MNQALAAKTLVATTAIMLAVAVVPLACAEQPKSLLQRVKEWQYPGSKVHGATMSDAATVNAKGERTAPSIQCKTVMTTADPIKKVVEFYETQLKEGEFSGDADSNAKQGADVARSVTFHVDSENRPLAVHIIHVNAEKTSTLLVITRAEGEAETHIAWSQYERF